MRVIILQDVENVGKKYDVKDVKPGFAKNYLLPKNLAKLATKEALKWLEIQKEIIAKKAEMDLKKIEEKVMAIDGQEVVVPVKLGDNDQLFESITPQKICERLKEMGFEIKKSQIILAEPIKEIGEFPIKLKFDHNLEGEIKVIITGEEEK